MSDVVITLDQERTFQLNVPMSVRVGASVRSLNLVVVTKALNAQEEQDIKEEGIDGAEYCRRVLKHIKSGLRIKATADGDELKGQDLVDAALNMPEFLDSLYLTHVQETHKNVQNFNKGNSKR